MKIQSKLILTLVLLIVSALPAARAFDAQLSPIMQRNYKLILELQKYTASPERFSDPRNRDRIKALVGQLRQNAHAIPERMIQTNPGQAAIGRLFGEYLGDAQRSLDAGSASYSRNKIRTATGFCMECHTSLKAEPGFIRTEKSLMASMNDFDKAEFFAATRQFELAIREYRKLFERPLKTEEDRIRFAHAVRGALSISVRVLQNPALTVEILDQVSKTQGLPSFLSENVRQWESDARAWALEGPIKAKTAGECLRLAQKLLERVESKQAYPADHSMDLSLLRAVGYAQEALAKNPANVDKARAFYVLGAANSVLADPLLWDLDEVYFESCIREVPHTPTARQCFDRFAQEVYFDYSGSAGLDLPEEDLERMVRLRELSE